MWPPTRYKTTKKKCVCVRACVCACVCVFNCSGKGVGRDSFKSILFTPLAKVAFRVWESVRLSPFSVFFSSFFFLLVIVMVHAVLCFP